MTEEQIGRYRLIRRLASGGMGEVYLGEVAGAANFTKQVAIKRILPHLAQDQDFVERFIDEANVMVQLQHGNIIPVLELSDAGGQLFIVMEYVPGRDLKNVIRSLRTKEKKIPIDLAVWLVRQVLDGLDYAHRKNDDSGQPMNIVHRDVSPGNIMLGAGGEVKLVDFGIARARGRLQNSVSGTLQGKFVYMSPEQAEGQPVDAQSDIFSCGLVLYELICGERPFEGESETDTLRKVRECRIVPPHHINPDIPSELSDVVMKALDAHPENRFTSAEEMAQSLRNFLVHQSSDAGAGRLSSFLETLYPEGVVPQEEYTPASIDDALNLQLDAFTPSIQSFEKTRTRTGPQAISAWAHSQSSVKRGMDPDESMIENGPTEGVETIQSSADTLHPPSGGRKRMLLLGLLLGATSAAAILISKPTDKDTNANISMVPLRVNVSPKTADQVVLSVDDAPFKNGDEVNGTVPHVVCASAPNFERTCEHVRTDRGEDTLTLTMQPLADLYTLAKPLKIDIHPDGLDALKFTVDNAPFRSGEKLDRNRTHVVCAAARNYQTHCERVRLQPNQDSLSITLRELPKLNPQVSPKGIEHSITVDGVETNHWPMYLDPEREYVVCASAKGYTSSPRCHRIERTQDEAQPRFELVAKTPDTIAAGLSAKDKAGGSRIESKDAKVISRKAMGSRKVRTASKSLTLKSIPTASVWVGSKQVGSTPFKAQINGKKTVYVLKARGYANTPFTVSKQTRPGVQSIALERPGYITLRVSRPPASEIWIDGRKVATGVLRRHPLTPGAHTVEVKYFQKRELVAAHRYPIMQLEAGQDLRLPPLVLDIEEKSN